MDKIAKFFCSLRLTVVLLSAGLLLVFLGTLAQVHEGLYQAQARYFRSWYIWQPTIGDSKWPLLLPGGYLIGSLLLFNLVAAHIKRFKFTVSKIGIQLTHIGIVLLLLGQLLTDMLSRESAMRLTTGMSKNFSEDFRENELTFINTSDPSADTIISIPESRLSRKETITSESLPFEVRVLDYWPNCEVFPLPPQQAVKVVADHGVYTNFSILPVNAADAGSENASFASLVEIQGEPSATGIYLVPSGMRGGDQIIHAQGKDYMISSFFAPMLGGNLLAVARAGDMGGKSMVTFTEAELARKGELANAGIPFKIKVREFWPKCRLYASMDKQSVMPKLTEESVSGSFVNPLPPVTDTDHRNLSGVVVELRKDGKMLGKYLLWTGWGGGVESFEGFAVSGKPYLMAYQFKRYYENFRIGLLKFSHDEYKGTDIPSNFSSRLRILNPQNNEDRSVLIKMNSPLRYKGNTYYQAGFDERDPDVTILQVVANPSWLTPYFACLIVGLGLIYQFSLHLWGFATKRRIS